MSAKHEDFGVAKNKMNLFFSFLAISAFDPELEKAGIGGIGTCGLFSEIALF